MKLFSSILVTTELKCSPKCKISILRTAVLALLLYITSVFCAPRDSPKSSDFYKSVPPNTNILGGLTLSEKSSFSIARTDWNPERKLGVAMYFSEIIELQSEKNKGHHCFGVLNLIANLPFLHELSLTTQKYRFKAPSLK